MEATDKVMEIPNGSSDAAQLRARAPVPVPKGRLSFGSQMYDLDGDGELDAAEQAMRDMDKSSRGYLTNEKVYKMVQEQLDTQKELFHVKRIMFVLLAVVVILAVSNLGTSFAAAIIAKDTTTNLDAELIDKASGEHIATQTSTENFIIERTVVDTDGRRRLCGNGNNDNCGDGGELTMPSSRCKALRKLCIKGKTVTLSRQWGRGQTTAHNICPIIKGKWARNQPSTLVNVEGLTVTIDPEDEEDDGVCRVGGEAMEQQEGDICLTNADCASSNSRNFGCMNVPGRVAGCVRSCEVKRWAESRMDECLSDCKYKSCESVGPYVLDLNN